MLDVHTGVRERPLCVDESDALALGDEEWLNTTLTLEITDADEQRVDKALEEDRVERDEVNEEETLKEKTDTLGLVEQEDDNEVNKDAECDVVADVDPLALDDPHMDDDAVPLRLGDTDPLVDRDDDGDSELLLHPVTDGDACEEAHELTLTLALTD